LFPSLPDALPAAAFFPRSAFRITPLKYRSASAARHRKPHSLLQPDANGADANINRPVEKKKSQIMSTHYGSILHKEKHPTKQQGADDRLQCGRAHVGA